MLTGLRYSAFFVVVFIIYYVTGKDLALSEATGYYDILFEADSLRVAFDMLIFDAPHDRSHIHPLFLLLFNPIGQLIHGVIEHRLVAAAFYASAVGALAAAVYARLFIRLTNSILVGFILASVIAFSSGHWLFSSTPETYPFASLALAICLNIFVVSLEKELSAWWWLAIAIVSFGITITNWFPVMILFAVSKYYRNGYPKTVKSITLLGLTSLICAICLSLMQNIVFPNTSSILELTRFEKEGGYASFSVFQNLIVFLKFLSHFFITPILAGDFVIDGIYYQKMPHLLLRPISQSWIWYAGTATLAGMSLFTCLRLFQNRIQPIHKITMVGLLLAYSFHILLHSFYGIIGERVVLLIYSGNFMPILIALLAIGLNGTKHIIPICLMLFALAFVHNALFINQIITIYNAAATNQFLTP